eukprot:6969217-Alexandrium_andersonii.AAC.1
MPAPAAGSSGSGSTPVQKKPAAAVVPKTPMPSLLPQTQPYWPRRQPMAPKGGGKGSSSGASSR